MNRVFQRPLWGWQLSMAVVLLITSWSPLVNWLFGSTLIFIAAISISVFLAVRWRSTLLLMPLLLNPMLFSFGLGLHEWFSEKPRFLYMGLPSNEFYNLDPGTRCYRQTGGCMVRGDEWITELPYDAGLRVMVFVFGFPKHTYHGPYPSQAVAVQFTETNAITSPKIFLEGKVQVDGKEIEIGQDTVKKIIRDSGGYLFEMDADDDIIRIVRAAIYQNRCLIIRIASRNKTQVGASGNEFESIVLFDLDGLHPIARYVLNGYAQRIPELLRN